MTRGHATLHFLSKETNLEVVNKNAFPFFFFVCFWSYVYNICIHIYIYIYIYICIYHMYTTYIKICTKEGVGAIC